MTVHRSIVLAIGGLALLPWLVPGSLAGNAGRADVTRRSAPLAPAPESLSAAFAARYGIDVELAEIIHRTAVKEGVTPAAAFGLIAIESGFDERAVGRAGSVGLMQIKPSTARVYDPRATRERLFNPEVNVRVGLAHLRRELAHFRNDWTLGLLSYNMGRARLMRALARGFVPRNTYASKVLAHCGEPCS